MRRRDWLYNRFVLVGTLCIAIAVGTLAVWPFGDPEEVPEGRVLLLELVYEQGYMPFTGDVQPAGAGLNGEYVYREASATLHSARGVRFPEDARRVVGVRVQMRPPLESQSFQWLVNLPEGRLDWDTTQAPTAGQIGERTPLMLLRVPIRVEAEPIAGEARVSVGARQTFVPLHGRETVWEGQYALPLSDLLSRMPAGADPERLRQQVAVGDDGMVTIHARVTAMFHGAVAVADTDLLALRNEADAAAQEGRTDAAIAAYERYLEVVPGDAAAQARLAELRGE